MDHAIARSEERLAGRLRVLTRLNHPAALRKIAVRETDELVGAVVRQLLELLEQLGRLFPFEPELGQEAPPGDLAPGLRRLSDAAGALEVPEGDLVPVAKVGGAPRQAEGPDGERMLAVEPTARLEGERLGASAVSLAERDLRFGQ